jgi:hypothetical protein
MLLMEHERQLVGKYRYEPHTNALGHRITAPLPPHPHTHTQLGEGESMQGTKTLGCP